jgi:hypothetical protein
VEQQLLVPVSARPWAELSARDRAFFCGDYYLPLHPHHAAQISLLDPADAGRVANRAFSAIPPGWPEWSDQPFEVEEQMSVHECWKDEARRAEVTRWLFRRGIPFRRTVYLLYERDRVVRTTWRMVVRYWDAFAWSVGYAMFAADDTLQWACCFHHEDVFVFGSHVKSRPDTRAG